MKPFFWRDTTNFGDYMNYWLWPKLLPDMLDPNDNLRLVGIGSLLKAELKHVPGKKLIFGAGCGYGNIPPQNSMEEWMFYFVRGPLSAKRLGLSPDKAIVDGAWLLSQTSHNFNISEKSGTTFVPHWVTAEVGDWENVCLKADIKYINPLDDFESIIEGISGSNLVITESLHGAIIADYFRTPWIPVQISPKFLNFKWHDWCQSVGLDFKLVQLPPSDILEYLYLGIKPYSINSSYEFSSISDCENLITKQATNKPPMFYKQKGALKVSLKNLRKDIFFKLKKHRSLMFYSNWNEIHQDKLSQLLKNLVKENSLMSHESIREEKIDKLNSALEKLKMDYYSGKLFDK